MNIIQLRDRLTELIDRHEQFDESERNHMPVYVQSRHKKHDIIEPVSYVTCDSVIIDNEGNARLVAVVTNSRERVKLPKT